MLRNHGPLLERIFQSDLCSLSRQEVCVRKRLNNQKALQAAITLVSVSTGKHFGD